MFGYLLDLLYLVDWARLRRALLEVCVALIIFTGLVLLLTWPTLLHLDEILLGGGELGGWRWREWWHFEEIESIENSDLGFFTTLSMLVGRTLI